MRPLADALGGGAGGFAAAGAVFGVWLTLPWVFVYAVTFERPARARAAPASFLDGVRSLARHPAYRSLTGLYLLGRVALDLTSAMFLYYFTHWLGRPDDFELVMGIFLVAVVLAMPLWLAVSRRTDKRTIFLLGAGSWVGAQLFLLAVDPGWPLAGLLLVAALAGAGYAAADMIPWSMLGEVVDEDELRTGQRREGMYFGFFTFLRKLGGAGAVALALFALDLAGFAKDQPQTETTLFAIRVLTAGVPGVFVLLAAWVALRYPLTRARHAEIQARLLERRAAAGTR
jgi:Na+/melibiose symporter-like transporter